MKKIYIAMAVIATAALASCQQEKSFNDSTPVGENGVVFAIQGGSATRSNVAQEPRQGIVIPLVTEDGHQFVLEETVTSLDEFFPETKGTPAYTENLGTLYANDLSVYAAEGSFGTATYQNMENSQYPRKDKDEENQGKGWRYWHNYPQNPWPASGEVGFYLNMPAAPKNVTFATSGRTGGKFTFDYTSPAKAAEQQDILFAYTSMSEEDHEGYLPNGAPVLFNHALTAVKFRIGNDAADFTKYGVAIKEITFNNLIDKGTCELTPTSEVTDGKTVYSSATAADWKNTSSTGTAITSGTFDGTVEYKASDKKFGESWYSSEAANTQNLNDANATQTFWLIPQEFTASSNVTLTIKYVFSGTEYTWTVDFGKALAGVNWKAGELRTYTIKVDDVNVTITDQFTTTVKNNVQIKNTGNTAAFIRAAIIGQWVDEEDRPIFGYTDYKTGDIVDIKSWYQDYVTDGKYFGEFVGLPGNGWTKEDDGYYYYETAVEPGQSPTALFTSYNVNTDHIPPMTVGGRTVNAQLFIQVATQAVTAKKNDGSYFTRAQAWENAETKAKQQ